MVRAALRPTSPAATDIDIRAASGRYRPACPIDAVDAWWLDELVRSNASRRSFISWAASSVGRTTGIAGATPRRRPASRRVPTTATGERFRQRRGHDARGRHRIIVDAAREYTDTDTIGQVITILEVADRGDEAARLLQTVIERHRREIGVVPDELGSRLRALVPQRPIAAHQRAAASVALRHPALDLAGTSPLIGQHDIVDTLMSSTSCLLLGPSGSGKTRLTAMAVDQLALSGQPCLYVIPLADDAPPLAALHVAVPSLASFPTPSQPGDDAMAEAVRQHWQHLVRLARDADDVLHVFVDDADA
ncbi:MAG: hypothetical protein R2710_30355, partial [Acidimicrobiales bacterium]